MDRKILKARKQKKDPVIVTTQTTEKKAKKIPASDANKGDTITKSIHTTLLSLHPPFPAA